MRDIWYGDNRDILKWGVLFHIARHHSLQSIVQIPYWRPETDRPRFRFKGQTIPINEEVWTFFRNVRHAERLGESARVPVRVFAATFNHRERHEYLAKAQRFIDDCPRPLLVFLDPDTGLEPSSANEKHTTKSEIQGLWCNLRPKEWLTLYQHARRENEWESRVRAELSEICGGASVETARSERVGADVAFLCVEKRAG